MLEGHATTHGLHGRQRTGRVWLHLVLVEQAEHALGGGKRALQHVHRKAQLREWLGGRRDVLEEGLEHAHGQLADDEHLAREHRDRDLAQAHDEADGRSHGVREEVRRGRRGSKALCRLLDLDGTRLVAAERLDDGAPAVGLLDASRERAERCLPGGGHLDRAAGEQLRHHECHRRERQEDAGEAHVHREHDEHGTRHGHDAREQLQHAALQDLGELVEVVRGTADGVAGLVRVEVGQRQARDLRRDLLAQAQVQALGKARHDDVVERVEHPRGRPDAKKRQHAKAAVLERERERLAGREARLDLVPQHVDDAGAEAYRGKRGHHVEHGGHGARHDAPAKAGHGLPQAAHGRKRVLGHLELLLGLGRLVLELLVVVSHGCPPSLPGTGRWRGTSRTSA